MQQRSLRRSRLIDAQDDSIHPGMRKSWVILGPNGLPQLSRRQWHRYVKAFLRETRHDMMARQHRGTLSRESEHQALPEMSSLFVTNSDRGLARSLKASHSDHRVNGHRRAASST